MKLEYYLKCLWWHWLVGLPFGNRLYIFVKTLLGQYPKNENVSEERFITAKQYRDIYEQYGPRSIVDSICFEFGAGYELFITMCLSSFGFKRIYTYDKVNWALPVAMNFAARHVKERVGFPAGPCPVFDKRNYRQLLSQFYFIDFNAPADASKTRLPDGSVDYVFANAVLEHIPKDILIDILKECGRIVATDGILAFEIDYRDHCRSRNISPYYFLRFSESEWERMYPPDGHNRMRHVDFRNLFLESGYEIVVDRPFTPFDPDFSLQNHSKEELLTQIQETPLSEEFSNYSREELAVLAGFWVLRLRQENSSKTTSPAPPE